MGFAEGLIGVQVQRLRADVRDEHVTGGSDIAVLRPDHAAKV
jgi:hypothetical protein